MRRYKTRDRLFVWDSQTQTLLNAGRDRPRRRSRSVTSATSRSTSARYSGSRTIRQGIVTGNLTAASGVGLFVQRITGRHRVLGKRAFKLRTVGRVPLGTFKKGKLRKRWDFRVNGKRLRPGRYLVTVRAVRGKTVRELGKAEGHPHPPALSGPRLHWL